MAGANTRMQVGLGIREYSKVYIGRWNSLQLYKYEIQKHENIKVQIRVLLGETLQCKRGLGMRDYSKVCIGNVYPNFIQIILTAAEKIKNIVFRSYKWN